MNNARRKELSALISEIEDVRSRLETVKEEEQEAYDNLPESLQDGERGEQMQAAIDAMENADSLLDDLIGSIEEAKE